jgi:hypothetical protein
LSQGIGEDVAGKLDYLDYQPGVFWFGATSAAVCVQVLQCCVQIVQAPLAPHVIAKGLPTTGLLAHVLVASIWTTCRWTAKKRSSSGPCVRDALTASTMHVRRVGGRSVKNPLDSVL